MEEKRDLRVQKTYDALIAAFQEMLSEKSFEEITVKELCARAKTRTATFYTHFSDKYDFFSFMVKELRRSFAKDAELTYNKEDTSAYYTALVCKGMDYLEHNEKLANSVKGNGMLRGMLQFMPDEITEELRRHLHRDCDGYEKLNESDVLLQFLIGGMNQVTEWWFANRRSLHKDAVSSDVDAIIKAMLETSHL